MHGKLVTKAIVIDISRFVLNILYNTDKSDLQVKILAPADLIKKRL